MSLSIGIVGLPNVGKSTLFNALTKAQNAQATNYPFCTIKPNKATVAVPDERLDKIAALVKPQKTIYTTVDFVDIAGLVRGASKGEGLGNQFLANIRECSAILEVVRCFDDENITHVEGCIDPLRDIETIETELILADIESIERKIEKTTRLVKTNKDLQSLLAELNSLLLHLDKGQLATSFVPKDEEIFKDIIKELGLLTVKKIIYCANIDEQGLEKESKHLTGLREFAAKNNIEVIHICAKLEEELQGLSEPEQTEILSSYTINEAGLDKVIHASYKALSLLSYFTAGEKEVRAWTIENGFKASQAAGVIHSDFERGFIRAEVIAYSDFLKYESEANCRAVGMLRTEGKDYIVNDADVIHFLFNV